MGKEKEGRREEEEEDRGGGGGVNAGSGMGAENKLQTG